MTNSHSETSDPVINFLYVWLVWIWRGILWPIRCNPRFLLLLYSYHAVIVFTLFYTEVWAWGVRAPNGDQVTPAMLARHYGSDAMIAVVFWWVFTPITLPLTLT